MLTNSLDGMILAFLNIELSGYGVKDKGMKETKTEF